MSLRLRLALLFSAMFVLLAAVLLTTNYYVVQNRETRSATGTAIICHASGLLLTNGVPTAASPTCDPLRNLATVPAPSPAGPGSGNVGFGGSGGSVPVPTPFQLAQRVVNTTQHHALHTLLLVSALALVAAALLSLGLAWWMAGRVLRPVRRVTETARRLSQETLHERIAMDGPDDELRELADTFDAMLGRLEAAFDSQRRFVANASHELRTPLATERVLIDEALAHPSPDPEDLRAILRALRDTSEDSERLLDALLMLARSEREVDGGEVTDLAALAASVVAAAEAAPVTLRTNLAPMPVRGDVTLLTRMIANLVDNAVRYNVADGGTVDVSTSPAGVLTVTNTGPPLATAEIPTLFEPFTRLGASRVASEGSGLGLSIVAAVVASHHGRIETVPGPAGGLSVRVFLPVAVRDLQAAGL